MTLTVIGASAGSGKTTRLAREVVAALGPHAATPLDVEALLAVTYTRRAAAELTDRLRRALVGAGAFERAASLPLALVGTVHGVCFRLVQAHALHAGVSPDVHVQPGAADRRLAEALHEALDPVARAELDALAGRLSIERDEQKARVDWVRPVWQILELARANRIDAGSLAGMAGRSWAGLRALMPAPVAAAPLEAAFDDALARAEDILAAAPAQGNTSKALKTVRDVRERRARGQARWSQWMTAARLEPAAALRGAIQPLVAAGLRVTAHTGLHADLERFTGAVYGAAARALTGYAAWKRRRGVVDFVDMLEQALALLEDPEVAAELGARLGLVVVDELQDTSPVQLALFARLHALAGRSAWVGDRKQCIFEYAGADPALMEAVVGWAGAGGGRVEHLERNYRSRAELVDSCSALFVRAFAPHGMVAGDVVVTAARSAAAGLGPPAGVWWLLGKNKDDDAEALAAGVRRLLDAPGATRVVDRATERVRDVRAGDVAILVATNAEAERVAAALHRRGLRAALARAGLLATPEGTFVTAALRAVHDARDTTAVATLEALDGFGGDADAWLAVRIAATTARREAGEAAPAAGIAAIVAALRDEVGARSPSEVLDLVLARLDVTTRCRRWPEPAQRLGNLDALRALAAAYEERSAIQREAATLAGLLRYLAASTEAGWVGEELLASDAQHVLADADAVTVVTYHRAKGLEWPVVVLASLERQGRRGPFDVAPESDRDGFDPDAPLAGRWIRSWPYPFGTGGSPLEDAAEASAVGRRVAEREARERVRLLYVGFTRARDHLVLAMRRKAKGPSCAWLDELQDAGSPLVVLPGEAERDDGVLGVRGTAVALAARVWRCDGAGTGGLDLEQAEPRRFARSACVPRPRYRIAPSRAADEWPPETPPRIGEVVRLGAAEPLRVAKDFDFTAAGTALHAFLAADVPGLPPGEREVRAARLLAGTGLEVARVIAAADALNAFVGERWPGAALEREVSVRAVIGPPGQEQCVDGVIDLLVRPADGGVVVVDHKLFPVDVEGLVRAKAKELAPQLSAYARVLGLLGERVVGTWFHFPFAARMVDIEVR